MTEILSFDALVKQVAALKASGKKIAHARGTFDLLGRGEVARLRAVCDDADVLVVTVAAGDGAHEPVVSAELRARVAASLPFVDAVALEERTSATAARDAIGADVVLEMDQPPESYRMLANEPRVGDATTEPDLRRGGPFTPMAEEFLREFRLRYTAEDVIAELERLKKLKVLVVGDTIIDEYHFVLPYGMPSKSPVVAAQFLDAEIYAGGTLAVANHIAGFCDQVDLVTVLGDRDSREDFVRSHLKPNIRPTIFHRPDAPTVVKRRYLLRYMVQKLLEIGFFEDRPLPPAIDEQVAKHLEAVCADYDLVVVSDFGHGLLSQQSADVLSRKSKFLAVNTQLNSMNYGYHVITKYERADYVCIDEPEIRIATRDRASPVHDLVPPLAERLGVKVFTVTRGHRGSLTYRPDGTYVSVPILSRQVVDTIGAGDAYLSITSPCMQAGFAPELVGFIGNAVGGLAVRILGNKESVTPTTLFPFIRSLLSDRG